MAPENAQKVFEGTKTQERRIVKGKVERWEDIGVFIVENPCPYGAVGDRLWIREAWNIAFGGELAIGESIGKSMEDCCRDNKGFACACGDGVVYKANGAQSHPEYGKARWRPAIHMPRWACRTVVELTEVWVERLQEISQADAITEGAPPSHPSIDKVSMDFGFHDFSRSWYAQLWESIHGPGSWALNPWVWVLTFAKVSA